MINWGILGTSFISGVMADAIAGVPGHQVYGVAGRSSANLAAFCQQHPTKHVFNDYAQIIADPEVDVIYIALPNHVHHEYILQAARAGKAILCEKSLSVDMEKTQIALAAIKEHKVFFLEGLMYLHHPLITELVAQLKSGVVGEVRSITARYGADIVKFVNPDSRGAIYNLGCYPASLIHLVMQLSYGEMANRYQIAANGRRGADTNIVETSALLTWPGLAVAHLHCVEDYGMFWDFSIQGSAGTLRIESNPWLPEVQGNVITVMPYEQPAQRIEISAEGDAFYYQVQAVGNALMQKQLEAKRPAVGLQDSLEIMQLLTEWESQALNFSDNFCH